MISQTTEYALRAMVHLAALQPGTTVNSEVLATCTKVPQGYLSKILRDLVVAELITSQRGPNGGFALARGAGEVSMLDVVNAVDPIQRIRKCPIGNPAHLNLCPLHRRIDDALDQIEQRFRETLLSELLSEPPVAGARCMGVAATVTHRGRTVDDRPKRGPAGKR
ncbi:MAG TPA: Rrf2 family transcriptional regulator [Phycisphaerales bacterium]|nr:Rrf2 family transcriptional regulator [Phycisphaerales bacterium]